MHQTELFYFLTMNIDHKEFITVLLGFLLGHIHFTVHTKLIKHTKKNDLIINSIINDTI